MYVWYNRIGVVSHNAQVEGRGAAQVHLERRGGSCGEDERGAPSCARRQNDHVDEDSFFFCSELYCTVLYCILMHFHTLLKLCFVDSSLV